MGWGSARKPALRIATQIIGWERMRQDVTWSCRGGGHLAVLPRAVWLQLESHEHPYYPRLQTGSMLMRGFVGAACFPLFAGTNVSKWILQRLRSLLLGQVKALLDALLDVWKDVAFVKN